MQSGISQCVLSVVCFYSFALCFGYFNKKYLLNYLYDTLSVCLFAYIFTHIFIAVYVGVFIHSHVSNITFVIFVNLFYIYIIHLTTAEETARCDSQADLLIDSNSIKPGVHDVDPAVLGRQHKQRHQRLETHTHNNEHRIHIRNNQRTNMSSK